MTILTVARDACLLSSLERPTTLFPDYDEGDTTPHDMVRAVTACARNLRDGYDWSVSKARHTFTALASETQTGKLPADFHRFIARSFWKSSTRQQVCGPLTDDEYAELKSGIQSRVMTAYHMLGGELLLLPEPTTSDTFAFGYIRTSIGKDDANARIDVFTEDTDVPLWDEELMILGTVYHYRKAKRYDAEQAFADFEKCRMDRIKRDGGARILQMGGAAGSDQSNKMKQAVIIGTNEQWSDSQW